MLSTLLLVTVASLFAVYQRNTARTQRDIALANQISSEADRLRSTDTSLAAQLDLTAYRLRPTPDRYTTLINANNTALSISLTGHTGSSPRWCSVRMGTPWPPAALTTRCGCGT